MRIGITEILVILVIVLVVFGGGKLAGVGKALGQSIRDFKGSQSRRRARQEGRGQGRGRPITFYEHR